MDWSNSFEQFLNQVSESQRQFFQGWTSAMPGTQDSNTQRMRESFDNVLNFQEQVVTSSLEFQALVTRFTIESQRQFWQNYFNILRSK
jgi:aspartate aminotransferase-like enzyme